MRKNAKQPFVPTPMQQQVEADILARMSGEPSPMQTYAMRVWDGQSISLPIAERVRRVEAALAEQGCTDMSAINLPASAE